MELLVHPAMLFYSPQFLVYPYLIWYGKRSRVAAGRRDPLSGAGTAPTCAHPRPGRYHNLFLVVNGIHISG